MKRPLRSLVSARVAAAVVIVVGINAVGASDQRTLNLDQNTAKNGPILLALEVPREAKGKGSTKAKVNCDPEGVILKGCDAVAYFKEGKPIKGNSETQSSYHPQVSALRPTSVE